jgi:hypothetical protein
VYAKQTQVHKIRETNFVNLHFKVIINPWVSMKFLHENDKVGRVTFFFLEKRVYCLISIQKFQKS